MFLYVGLAWHQGVTKREVVSVKKWQPGALSADYPTRSSLVQILMDSPAALRAGCQLCAAARRILTNSHRYMRKGLPHIVSLPAPKYSKWITRHNMARTNLYFTLLSKYVDKGAFTLGLD